MRLSALQRNWIHRPQSPPDRKGSHGSSLALVTLNQPPQRARIARTPRSPRTLRQGDAVEVDQAAVRCNPEGASSANSPVLKTRLDAFSAVH